MAYACVGVVHVSAKCIDDKEPGLGSLAYRNRACSNFKIGAAPLRGSARVSKVDVRLDATTGMVAMCSKRPYCARCRRAERICLCGSIEPFSR
eukprot:9470913-Pyramimonas_sp.AAC.1